MNVVLDAGVLVAGTRSSRGASNRLLVAALDGRYRPLLSVPLVLQYEAVLTRPEHLDAAGLSAADIGILLDTL